MKHLTLLICLLASLIISAFFLAEAPQLHSVSGVILVFCSVFGLFTIVTWCLALAFDLLCFLFGVYRGN